MTQTITIDAKLSTLLERYRKACRLGSDAIAREDYEAAADHIDQRNEHANAIALWLEILDDEQRLALQEAA